jgi:hypothetical protein
MRGVYDGRNPRASRRCASICAAFFLSLRLSILNLKRCRTDFKSASKDREDPSGARRREGD